MSFLLLLLFDIIQFMKKMLLIFAHLSDESFYTAATIAKYMKSGWTVDLMYAICPEKVVKLPGISSLTFLDYKDGTLREEPSGKLEDELFKKMEELVPDCVITMDTTGIDNNPDHIRLCYSTTYAFQKYAAWIEEMLKEDPEYDEKNAPKLYYACVPESVALYLKKKKIFPEVSFDRPLTGTPDKFVTTTISADGFQRVKMNAVRMHNGLLFLTNNPLLKQEYYIFRMHGTREIFMGKNDRVAAKL
jgi:LmbE family N-acetylglucosaminyl deacetylase